MIFFILKLNILWQKLISYDCINAYLCDGRVDVVETINGANILTLNRTEKKAETFFGREKKIEFHYQKIIRMQILTSQVHLKKGKPKKVHHGNLVDHRFFSLTTISMANRPTTT